MSSSPSASSVVSQGDYAPSPNTCSQALVRANQLRIQALLRQLISSDTTNSNVDQLNSLRVLRKTLRELNYELSWLSQIDLLETIEKILTGENPQTSWHLIEDSTQLLIEAIPKFAFDLDQQTLNQLFPVVIHNLGHSRSEIRRSSLLLINMYLNERPQHFQYILRLFIDHGLKATHNYQIQKGSVLSLPLLMTEPVVSNENLLPLIKCLSEMLVSDDHKSQSLFYSLYLALQRLQLTIGAERFYKYMSKCSREAQLLYDQAASRNNSLVGNQLNLGDADMASDSDYIDNRTTNDNNRQEASSKQEVIDNSQLSKQVTFENDAQNQEPELSEQERPKQSAPKQQPRRSTSKSSQELTTTTDDDEDFNNDSIAAHHHVSINTSNFDQSSVSSTCSSQAKLVEPSHYMSREALQGKPLSNLDKLHHFDHSNIGLTINDINVSCSPTIELGPQGDNFMTPNELKFGIFPKHLIQVALNSHNHLNRIEALEEIMCIIRDSPINHLAILMTYFDSFLKQFLTKLMDSSSNNDYKIELIAIDMIETIVIKTKLSTIQYIRPMVGLLIMALGDSRVIFRDNTVRVIHKMMAYLPPQHVIDAIFEHKHHKSALVREESINRVTAAVLEYNKNEFNLTKLCYHVIPMLADHHAQVRLASLECLAVLAQALGQERIGSLLTAAEAVQTGCDYDGLLDAINARLVRKSLPRCNSDGSIRYVLKPFLSSNFHIPVEQQPADIRWILEAPSSHQHVSGGGSSSNANYVGSTGADGHPHHAHRPGAYSPPEPLVHNTSRRASMAPQLNGHSETAAEAATALGGHRHHHHQPKSQSGNQQQQQPQAASRRPSIARQPQNGHGEANNCHFQPRPEVGGSNEDDHQLGQGKRNSNSENFNQKQTGPEVGTEKANRHDKKRNSQSNSRPSNNRSNSEESYSSQDTNKVLFQYYLNKFRQSLSDESEQADQQQQNRADFGNNISGNSDSVQAYHDLNRLQSRFQQTSFDYEKDSVGKIPAPKVSSSKKKSSDAHKTNIGAQDDYDDLIVGRQQQQQSASSGTESPVTVMERAQHNQRRNSRPQQQQQELPRRKSVASNEPKSAETSRRQSSNSLRKSISHQESQTENELESDKLDGAAEDHKPRRSISRKPSRAKLQRSHATIDSPVSANEEPVNANQQHEAHLDQEQTKPAHSDENINKSAVNSSADSSLNNQSSNREKDQDLQSNTGSENSSTHVGTQTNDDELEENPRRRESRRRRNSRRSLSQSRQSKQQAEANEEGQEEANNQVDDSDLEELNAIRKRASRSQPPQRQASQLARSPSKSTLILGSDRGQQQQRSIISSNDLKRSVSVSPSLANQNINIRHILENVAELEGPFQEPQLAFKVAFNALESACWSTKVEGILALIRLVNHHQQLVLSHLHEVTQRLAQETKNLRSTVARSAIYALGDFCSKLKRLIEPEMELIVQALLNKSIENNGFIRDDIRKALAQMVDSLTQWKLAMSLINYGSAHKNQLVRKVTSQFVGRLVERMGAAKCLVGARDISSALIPAAAKFAQDNSPQTRYFGRLILLKLMQHGAFDRLMRKNLTPNLYRSTVGILESIKRRGAGEPPADL